jgi:hypothetical protein
MGTNVFGMTLIVIVAASVLASFQNSVVQGSPCPGFPQETLPLETAATSVLISTHNALAFRSPVGTSDAGAKFLAIQNAQSGSNYEINSTAYILELNNVSDSTALFSDRPDRIVASTSTSDFIGNWTAGQDSFSADTPNAALLVIDIQTGKLDTAVVELFSPVYDMTTGTLTYTIMAENSTSIDLPGEFGQTTLVIDSSEAAAAVVEIIC